MDTVTAERTNVGSTVRHAALATPRDVRPESSVGAPRRGVTLDEIDAVATMLKSRFPKCRPEDVESLVVEVHAELAAHARVHAHLIPLTLNRCRSVLAKRSRST